MLHPAADLLIRDVPDEVLAAIDGSAHRLGLSPSAYVHRVLAREAATVAGTVTLEDLSHFAETFADLADSDVMRQAWR